MAITQKYASPTGVTAWASANSPSAPCSLTEALANAAAGSLVWLMPGTYSRSASDSPSGLGTTASPIIFRGYNATPGDLNTRGRLLNGQLNTSGFPVIAYDATFGLTLSQYFSLENCVVTGNRDGNLISTALANLIRQVSVTNASTGASAFAIASGGNNLVLNLIDAETASATSTARAVSVTHAASIIDVRAKGAACSAFHIANSGICLIDCVAHGSATGFNVGSSAGSRCTLSRCTAHGCTVVFKLPNSAVPDDVPVMHAVHFTDCTTVFENLYAGTANVPIVTIDSRYRDYVTLLSGFGDSADALGWRFGDILTDGGGAETDYVDAVAGNFRLKPGSSGTINSGRWPFRCAGASEAQKPRPSYSQPS